MRRFAFVLAASVLAVSSTASGGGANFNGQVAPELALTDGLNGASAATTLASLRGKVVCLKFWLTHCPVCRRTLPEFQQIHDRYGRSGVVCLGVVIDNAAGVAPYVASQGYKFLVGCDPNATNAARYGVGHYPADYVIGADGVVRASNGFPREAIDAELRKLRALELGAVPAGLEAARAAVEDGNYGEALRRAEAAAKAAGATAEVKSFLERLTAIATRRFDNRLARVESLRASGNVAAARAELDRIVVDFKGTSLEARAVTFKDSSDGMYKGR